MDSPRFMFPHRAFPGIVRRRETASVPALLFTEVAGDGGLRHAVRYYWSAKKITLEGSGSGTSRTYHDAAGYPYPTDWEPTDIEFAWSKTYVQYAADAGATMLFPDPTAVETKMHPPMTRIQGIEGYVYGSDPVRYLIPSLVSGAWTVIATSTRFGSFWMEWLPTEIVWSTTHNRYAILVAPAAHFTGSDASIDGDTHAIYVGAILKPEGYSLGAGESTGTLTLPAWLEATGDFVVSAPTVFNPITGYLEYTAADMFIAISAEFWTYAT